MVHECCSDVTIITLQLLHTHIFGIPPDFAPDFAAYFQARFSAGLVGIRERGGNWASSAEIARAVANVGPGGRVPGIIRVPEIASVQGGPRETLSQHVSVVQTPWIPQ